MKFFYPLLLLFFLFTACSEEHGAGNKDNASAAGVADTIKGTPGASYKRYSGTIGSRHIVLNLVKYKTVTLASYYTLSDNRPMILSPLKDSTAVTNDFDFNEGKQGEITWHLKETEGRLLGNTISSKDKSEPIELKEEYPEGSFKMIAYYYTGKGRLLENFADPQASADYGMLWPAGNWNGEQAAFVRSRISVNMKFEGTNGVEEGLKTRAKRYYAGYRNELRSVVDSNWPEVQRKDVAYNYGTTFYHKVIYNDNSWLVLEDAISNYTGGAHGLYNSSFQSLDMKTNREWTIDQVVTDTAALKPYLELAARDYFGIQSTEDIGSRLLVSEVPATVNFYITPSGLTFVYNPYEIASYADGEIQLFIPYEKLMNILASEFKTRMNFTPGTGTALNQVQGKSLIAAHNLSFNHL